MTLNTTKFLVLVGAMQVAACSAEQPSSSAVPDDQTGQAAQSQQAESSDTGPYEHRNKDFSHLQNGGAEPDQPAIIEIKGHAVAGIRAGDDLQQLVEAGRLKKNWMHTGEGRFDIWNIVVDDRSVGYALQNPRSPGKVGTLVVTAANVKTSAGIGVGDSLADLKAAMPDAKVHGSEVEGRTSALSGRFAFELDARNFSHEIDQASVDPATKITAIRIRPR